ncbi:hypothetical protein AX17_007370 [Amanita inopinata Kibby_2008]|nr:hypothetical protein AX17_007370 [Amanita inopinata Kibby_2008]
MRLGGTAALLDLPIPALCYSLDVNALNFCRFSLLRLSPPLSSPQEERALIAVPNLIESSAADIWALHGCDRIHASIGQELNRPDNSASEFGPRNTYGIIMSMHLYLANAEASSSTPAWPTTDLRLLCAYENGSVILRKYTRPGKLKSVEGAGWETIWNIKRHAESVMAMRVSRTNDFALTVSADHIVGKYNLKDEIAEPDKSCTTHRTKHLGNGCIAIHDEGRVCAIGGWDGRIRLYSTKSLKPLGTLRYHKTGCQAIEFAHCLYGVPKSSGSVMRKEEDKDSGNGGGGDDDDDDDDDAKDRVARSRWLVSGGKDHRVSIWEMVAFGRRERVERGNAKESVDENIVNEEEGDG